MPDVREQQAQQVFDVIEQGPTPGASDMATEMLTELFGQGWTEILWSGQEVQGDASLIMPLLQWFNWLMLAAVTLILLYVVSHAFIGSAHEGTPLGRRLHSIWVPVRSVFSISLLAPIPWSEALNFAQGIVLCFVGFSIQFANYATTAAVDFLIENQGQVVAFAPTDLSEEGSRIAEVALHNYLIQYHQYYFQENDRLVRGYDKKVIPPIDGLFGPGSRNYTLINYHFRNPEPYSNDTMGGITIKCKVADSALCNARQSAAENLLDDSETVASNKVRQLYGLDHNMPPPHAMVEMVNAYDKTIVDAIKEKVARNNPELLRELRKFETAIKNEGFAMLGSYIWAMSRFSTALQDQISATADATDYNSKLLTVQTITRFNDIEISLSSLDSYCRQFQHAREVAELGSGSIQGDNEDGLLDKLGALFSRPFVNLTNDFILTISSNDPIANLSAYGHHMMNTMNVCLAGVTGTIAVANAGTWVPLAGKVADGIINGTLGKLFMTLFLLIMVPVYMLGFTLAYYLPAVPFIIWIVSVFGWILMVLEALIAAPIWAAMHAAPDGEGLAGEKGAQGYAIFVQVLLRPVLMVVGFFFALLLVHVVSYAGGLFSVFFDGLSANETLVGPVTAIAGIFLGSIIMVILVHKAFQLIYQLPEGIAKWMGGVGMSQMGEAGDMAESKSVFVGGVAGTWASTGEHTGGSLKGGAKNAAKLNNAGGEGNPAQGGGSDDHSLGQSGGGENL